MLINLPGTLAVIIVSIYRKKLDSSLFLRFRFTCLQTFWEECNGFFYLVRNYLRIISDRRHWVDLFISYRLLKGIYYKMPSYLNQDEGKCYNCFRKSMKSFDELASRMTNAFKGKEMKLRLLSTLEVLTVTLW